MRRPQGQLTSFGEGRTVEADTITCAHDNKVVVVTKDPGSFGFCRRCMQPICGTCADKGGCDPFDKKLERIEQSARFMEALK